MNIPLGSREVAAKKLSPEDVVNDLREFMDNRRDGCFVVALKGEKGIEEGLIVIGSGMVIAAHYEYLRYGKEYNAGEALKRCSNAFFASRGIYEVYSLTGQQLELLKIFNESLLLLEGIPLRSFEGMMPVAFSEEYEKQVLAEFPEEETRDDILKKRGMSEVRIDNYDVVAKQMESSAEITQLPEEVEKRLDEYLKGKPTPEEPTDEASVEESEMPKKERVSAAEAAAPTTPGEEELAGMDQAAEKLEALLKKRREGS
ncbi:MAG: hypothetical protein JW834_00770 [Candidatus Diapherotrites archaeon]|nr:hypothetical protein [Candidatus Diapherotrites archaeon]